MTTEISNHQINDQIIADEIAAIDAKDVQSNVEKMQSQVFHLSRLMSEALNQSKESLGEDTEKMLDCLFLVALAKEEGVDGGIAQCVSVGDTHDIATAIFETTRNNIGMKNALINVVDWICKEEHGFSISQMIDKAKNNRYGNPEK